MGSSRGDSTRGTGPFDTPSFPGFIPGFIPDHRTCSRAIACAGNRTLPRMNAGGVLGNVCAYCVGGSRFDATNVRDARTVTIQARAPCVADRPLAVAHGRQPPSELKIIAVILEQAVIEQILTHLGLQARAPPPSAARDQALQAA